MKFDDLVTQSISRRIGLFLAILAIGLFVNDGCRSRPEPDAADASPRFSAAVVQRHNRAVALMGQFDYAGACGLLEQLAAAHPDWLGAKIDLAIAKLNRRQAGDPDEAISLLREVIAKDPDDLRAYYCLGILSLDQGDPAAAGALFAKVAASDLQDAYAAYYAGQCEFQMGQVQPALARYERAMKIDPYLRSCYYGAFQASLRLGQTDLADQYRKEFERLDGNPQARLAEMKYTRMGPKAELRAIETIDVEKVSLPDGALFASAAPIRLDGDSPVPWVRDLSGANATVVDLSGDGELTLFLARASQDSARPNVVLRHVGGAFRWVVDHPLSAISSVNTAVWGDYDNDGLVDVYLCRTRTNQLWRQVSPGQWQNVTEESGTDGGQQNTLDGQFFDADHDGDLDLFLANDGPNELLNNNLDGTFRRLASDQGLEGGPRRSISTVVADLDRDRDLDLIVVYAQPPHDVFINDRLWAYHPAVGFEDFRNHPLLALVAADRDVDGRPELIGLDADGLVVWAANGEGGWTQERLRLRLGAADMTPRPPLGVADLDGDGRLDLVASSESGCMVVDALSGQVKQSMAIVGSWRFANLSSNRGPSLVVLSGSTPQIVAPGPGRFDFLRVQFTGKDEKADQMRSNRSGIGVEAAARLGTQWTSLRTLRCDSGPGQSLQPIAVGLRGRPQLDFVSVTWPDGVYQTEFDFPSGQLRRVTETQRQIASCPVVFAWNGEAFEFVTDVLGAGGLGFNLGDGQYGEPRPWENLLMTAHSLQPRDGRFQIKLGEPMEEACYLDAARLVAYDLHHDWQMTLDERFGLKGPAATGRPLFYRREQRPVRATNDRGDSILSRIARADWKAAEPGSRDRRFIGRTQRHSVELTFAHRIDHSDPYLLFDGWIEYPYSQTMFAAWQADASFDAPTIEAASPSGPWRKVIDQFGYMAGMPRQAVVPLDLDRLPRGTTRLRISTNLEIYWDRLSVIHAETPPTVTRHELPLHLARVAEVGFPQRTTRPQRRPHYDYARRTPLWDTRHLAGAYSELGPVLELVSDVDDTLAIFGPGEEIHLEFGTPAAPPSADRRRWFVLELNGWCKDMDLYTHEGETVLPLPVSQPTASPAQRQRRERLHRQNHRRYRSGN